MKIHGIACAVLGLALSLPGAAALAEGSWTDQVSLFGDFRGRYEGFYYDADDLGGEKDDRNRLRYRFRLGIEAEINEYIDLGARLATGNESRSRNQTLGSGDDFDPDAFNVDQAYIALHPATGTDLPARIRKAELIFGKFSNLWLSKKGKDYLLWDSDITPEGAAIALGASPVDNLDLTLNTGYLIFDENSSAADPHVVPVQLRVEGRPMDGLSGGINASYYAWRSLNDDFRERASQGGNIVLDTDLVTKDGLTDDSGIDIGDLRGWIEFEGIEDWPILVYGNVVKNFSAKDTSGYGAGKEDMGWSLGAAIGDKKKWVQLGAGYFDIDANAVPANFTDSDVFDGHTNAKGWAIHGARQIFKNTELSFEIFLRDEENANKGAAVFDEDAGAWGVDVNPSIPDSDRIRFRTNVVVKF